MDPLPLAGLPCQASVGRDVLILGQLEVTDSCTRKKFNPNIIIIDKALH